MEAANLWKFEYMPASIQNLLVLTKIVMLTKTISTAKN